MLAKKYVSKNLRSCVRQFNLGATARIATLVEEFHDGGVAMACKSISWWKKTSFVGGPRTYVEAFERRPDAIVADD